MNNDTELQVPIKEMHREEFGEGELTDMQDGVAGVERMEMFRRRGLQNTSHKRNSWRASHDIQGAKVKMLEADSNLENPRTFPQGTEKMLVPYNKLHNEKKVTIVLVMLNFLFVCLSVLLF